MNLKLTQKLLQLANEVTGILFQQADRNFLGSNKVIASLRFLNNFALHSC